MFTIANDQILGLVKGWPIYLVVAPHHMGIYDDIILLLNDNKGRELYYSTKKTIKECKTSAISYYKHFWPTDKMSTDININKKNTMFKV